MWKLRAAGWVRPVMFLALVLQLTMFSVSEASDVACDQDYDCLECKSNAVFGGILEMELCESDIYNGGDKIQCIFNAYNKTRDLEKACEEVANPNPDLF
jgi:hypothetical protein